MSLKKEVLGSILNQYLVEAVENSLEELLEANCLRTILTDDWEDGFNVILEYLVHYKDVFQESFQLLNIKELSKHREDWECGFQSGSGERLVEEFLFFPGS